MQKIVILFRYFAAFLYESMLQKTKGRFSGFCKEPKNAPLLLNPSYLYGTGRDLISLRVLMSQALTIPWDSV